MQLAPRLIYGTAWKQEQTADLVVKAVLRGFRAIDTACQPLHYNESGVGEALNILQTQHGIARKDLFLQTKYSPYQSLETCPFDCTELDFAQQVKESFKISQTNLGVQFVDSLLLHAPMKTWEDMQSVWGAMEDLVQEEKVGQIGLSNMYDVRMLQKVHEAAKVKPRVVQNRFYSNTNFDKEIRQFCLQNKLEYQAFWTLTANPYTLRSGNMLQIAKEHNATPEQVFYRFLLQEGISPLTGTTQEVHMQQDLDVYRFELSAPQCKQIRQMLDMFSGLV